MMGRQRSHSAGKKGKLVMSLREKEDRKFFESYIEEMDEEDEKTMPMLKIVKYHGKLIHSFVIMGFDIEIWNLMIDVSPFLCSLLLKYLLALRVLMC